jgi:Multiubiquitin
MAPEELVEVVDIEACARESKDKPKGKLYRFRIDKEYYETPKHELTGREILAFAGKTPEAYILSEKTFGGGVRTISADEVVDLRKKGIERFMTVKREATEGR